MIGSKEYKIYLVRVNTCTYVTVKYTVYEKITRKSNKASADVSKEGIGTAVVVLAIKTGSVWIRATTLFCRSVTVASVVIGVTAVVAAACGGRCSTLVGVIKTASVGIGHIRVVHLVLSVLVKRGELLGIVDVALAE